MYWISFRFHIAIGYLTQFRNVLLLQPFMKNFRIDFSSQYNTDLLTYWKQMHSHFSSFWQENKLFLRKNHFTILTLIKYLKNISSFSESPLVWYKKYKKKKKPTLNLFCNTTFQVAIWTKITACTVRCKSFCTIKCQNSLLFG